jgi:PEP-CTERM motif
MKTAICIPICCVPLLWAAVCGAQSTTFSDGTAFRSAANALVSYDLRPVAFAFDALVPEPDRDYLFQTPYAVIPGIDLGAPPGPIPTYTSSATFEAGGGLNLLASSFTSESLAGPVLRNFDNVVYPLSVHFADPVYALGANFSSDMSPSFSSFTATLTLDTGEEFTFTAQANPYSAFFGFISPTPVRELTFSDGGIAPIGNGFYAHEEQIGDIFTITQVPEPSALALLGLGGLALGWRARRHRGSRAAVSGHPVAALGSGSAAL